LPPQSLTHLSVSEREPFALSQSLQLAQQPFDLAQAPLFRGALFQLDETAFVLLLNFHHLLLDGWSVGVLWGELSALYAAFADDRPLPLPALTLQYADFAVWQRQCLQGQFRELLLQYWQQQLEGVAFEPLPTSRSRPTVPTRRSACQTSVVPAAVTTALKALSRQQGVTLFVTLLAAFELLLHCYTGRERFVVCTPAANRNRKELKGMVGYFVNLLILRADLAGDPSVVALLHRVRQSVSGAFAHQDLPFQQAIEALNLGRAPLTQVMFALQNFPQQALQLAELEVTPLAADNGTADFDLFLSLTEVSGELQGELKYNTDVFDPAHISQMLEHYQAALRAMAIHPDRPLSSSLPSDLAPVLRVVSAPTPQGDAFPTIRYQLQGKGEGDRAAVLIAYLQTQIANLLGCAVGEVLAHRPLSQMGLDSLKAIALQHQLISALGIDLSLEKLVEGSTIAQLVPLLLDRIAFQELTPTASTVSSEDLEEIVL
jgi:aryl carrier-like protein